MIERTGYTDVDVVIDGAVDASRTFTHYNDGTSQEFGGTISLSTYLRWIEKDATENGYVAEIFTLFHEHDMSEDECSCAQYLTDHHPSYVYGESSTVLSEGE